MKVLLDIKDEKSEFVLELLRHFDFVSAEELTPKETETLEGLKEAVEEVNQIKAGKKKGKPLNEFLDEL